MCAYFQMLLLLWKHLLRDLNLLQAYLMSLKRNPFGFAFPSHFCWFSVVASSKYNTRQPNTSLTGPYVLPEMCLMFKDGCPNVLKTDPLPRYISDTSISEIPGQCPGSHTIFILIFISFYFVCICFHKFLIYQSHILVGQTVQEKNIKKISIQSPYSLKLNLACVGGGCTNLLISL